MKPPPESSKTTLRLTDLIPWLLATAVLLIASGVMVSAALELTYGKFTYLLDDTYIHMAVAKNFAEHGVWGVTRWEFTNAVSSILWPSLLSIGFWVQGVNEYLPLVLNGIFGAGLLGALAFWLRNTSRHWFIVFGALTIITFGAGLPLHVFTGMEHVMHAMFAVAFAIVFVEASSSDEQWTRLRIPLFILAMLLAASRFEGLLEVAGAVAILLVRRRFRQAIALGCVAWIPVAVYGLISLEAGWYFFPNSVLLKAKAATDLTFWNAFTFIKARVFHVIKTAPHIAFYTLTILAAYAALANRKTRTSDFMLLFLLTAALHTVLGRFGWLYRYEMYLLVFGLAAGLKALPEAWRNATSSRQKVAIVVLTLLVLGPIGRYGELAWRDGPMASRNIYEQHIQSARFVSLFPGDTTVIAQDIGAISYFNDDIHLVDLWGLASMAVARARRAKNYTSDVIQGQSQDKELALALAYESSIGHILPKSWVRIGTMKISDNVAAARTVVTVYATRPELAPLIATVFSEFRATLPPGVSSELLYDTVK